MTPIECNHTVSDLQSFLTVWFAFIGISVYNESEW